MGIVCYVYTVRYCSYGYSMLYVYTVRYCSFLFFVCILILSVCYLLIATLLGE